MANTQVKDEVIELTQVEKAPRGRKANVDPALVKILAGLESGKAVALRSTFGEVAKEQRPNISQKIRSAWKASGQDGACTVNYSPTGVPQVSHKMVKAS